MPSPRLLGALFLSLSILLVAPQLHAQASGSAEAPIDRLRREIASLKGTGCNPATSALIRGEFSKLIETRQAELSLLLEQQIAEVEAAPQNAGVVLTAEDKKTIADFVATLQAERKALQSGRPMCDASGGESPPDQRNNAIGNDPAVTLVAAVSAPRPVGAVGLVNPVSPAADPPNQQPVTSSAPPAPPAPAAPAAPAKKAAAAAPAASQPESSTPWGRVRPYLSGGMVLSQNNGQFSSQNLYLGFNLDKNWFYGVERQAPFHWQLNTYFDSQLTAIPTASCQSSSSSASGTTASTCPSSSGSSTNNLSNFITSQKAAVIQGGIYVPIYLNAWRWSYNGDNNTLFLGPIFKGGYQSLTGGSQTVASPTPGTSTTVSTVNDQTLYYFYAGGVRLGHYDLFNSWNIAPDLLSHLDIVFGKWQNFEQCAEGSCSGTSATVLPTMIALEGRLKIPSTFFQIGFDAISPLTKASGTKGDLRFIFGAQLDPSCLFNAFTGTASTLNSCVQGHSTSGK